ncbi:hypothetical protein ACF0H5_017514 [Mactra antiquata]
MSATDKVNLQDVKTAYTRIKSYIKKTPVFQDGEFDTKYGRNFFFKAESMQVTGAFKFRGALNAVLKARENGENINGLVSHSSGNHGKALAFIARKYGMKCVIVCPTTTPESKRQLIRDLGAELILCKPDFDERLQICMKIEKERPGFLYVSTCDDYDVIAGQGTMALELLDQVNDLDAILVPCSGGGMAAGICIAAKALKPDIQIYIVEPVGKELEKCLRAGKRLWPNSSGSINTIADGMRRYDLGHKTWPIVLELAEKDVFTITDEEAIEGMKYGFEHLKLVVESSAGTSIAAAMSSKLDTLVPRGRNVGVILSGGNVDFSNLPF